MHSTREPTENKDNKENEKKRRRKKKERLLRWMMAVPHDDHLSTSALHLEASCWDCCSCSSSFSYALLQGLVWVLLLSRCDLYCCEDDDLPSSESLLLRWRWLLLFDRFGRWPLGIPPCLLPLLLPLLFVDGTASSSWTAEIASVSASISLSAFLPACNCPSWLSVSSVACAPLWMPSPFSVSSSWEQEHCLQDLPLASVATASQLSGSWRWSLFSFNICTGGWVLCWLSVHFGSFEQEEELKESVRIETRQGIHHKGKGGTRRRRVA